MRQQKLWEIKSMDLSSLAFFYNQDKLYFPFTTRICSARFSAHLNLDLLVFLLCLIMWLNQIITTASLRRGSGRRRKRRRGDWGGEEEKQVGFKMSGWAHTACHKSLDLAGKASLKLNFKIHKWVHWKIRTLALDGPGLRRSLWKMERRLDWTVESSNSPKTTIQDCCKRQQQGRKCSTSRVAVRSRKEFILSHKVINWTITAGADKLTGIFSLPLQWAQLGYLPPGRI